MNFKEAKENKLSNEDRRAISALAVNKDFMVFRDIIENYTMQLTYNLVSGTEIEKESAIEELKKLRGFVYYWNKTMQLVDNKDIHTIYEDK